MEILPVPCLSDNYAYLVRASGRAETVVVDPGTAAPVIRALETRHLRLVGLLCTHHHVDHVGGVSALRRRYGSVPVHGHSSDQHRIPELTHPVNDGDVLHLAELEFEVWHVPGHTLGALAYRVEQAIFTGDTLFGAGCGRLFEGTARQMYESLQRFAKLPHDTQIYPGHEYTLANLSFAARIEPQNARIAERKRIVSERLARGELGVPFDVADELKTNPFMRVDRSEIRSATGVQTAVPDSAVFATLRKQKDGSR